MMIQNRYELGEVIGNGGMSDVYLATDTLLGRQVAVKMMRIDLARDPNFHERFRREATNVSRLSHPNIVAVYDTGDVSMHGVDVPYIVMELVQGRTLRDIMREDGQLTPATAAEILVPVCQALHASHEAGIIHRDIKPANIMITNTGAVKIMDFGIARAINDNNAAMTQTSAVIGTAQYLSPEQARGKVATESSDVYALGCVLYEMITSRPPFAGESPFSVAYQHVHDDPTPPSEFIAGLSPTEALNVDAVTLTAMAKHPSDRYADAMEFAADLQRLSRGVIAHAAHAHLPHTAQSESPQTAEQSLADAATTTFPAVTGAADPNAALNGAALNGAALTGTAIGVTQANAAHANAAQAPDSGRHRQPVAPVYPAAEQKKSRWPVVVTTVLFVGLLAGAGAITYNYLTPDSPIVLPGVSDVEVTDVTALPAAQAEQLLSDLGVKVITMEQTSPTITKGLAIGTNPAAGSSVRKGTTVTLFVSSGKEATETPDLSGKTLDEAARVLNDAGLSLNVQVKEDHSADVPKGEIMSQTPAAGTSISKGSKVSVTVSLGQEEVRVPVVSGIDWKQAESTLTAAGFVADVSYVDSPLPAGQVISVAGEGGPAERGSHIEVEISRGNMITMPAVTGMVTSQAISALRAAGWTAPETSLHVEQIPTPHLLDQGSIATQLPEAGTPILKDAQVTLQVNVFNLLP